MKTKLTENLKHFIESLNETERSKIIVTEDTVEFSDESLRHKLRDYHMTRARRIGAELRSLTDQLRVDHPEYFE